MKMSGWLSICPSCGDRTNAPDSCERCILGCRSNYEIPPILQDSFKRGPYTVSKERVSLRQALKLENRVIKKGSYN